MTAADLILLMCAPVHVANNAHASDPDLWKRYLAIIVDGLRPAGASALSPPAPILG